MITIKLTERSLSVSIFTDMTSLYAKYGMFDQPMDRKKFDFRMELLSEEIVELDQAITDKDSEEVVDALIDMIVIAAGTLQLLRINGDQAWKEVFRANLAKKRGTKSTRPGSGGFDLVKPEGWTPPSHATNHGELDDILVQEA